MKSFWDAARFVTTLFSVVTAAAAIIMACPLPALSYHSHWEASAILLFIAFGLSILGRIADATYRALA